MSRNHPFPGESLKDFLAAPNTCQRSYDGFEYANYANWEELYAAMNKSSKERTEAKHAKHHASGELHAQA